MPTTSALKRVAVALTACLLFAADAASAQAAAHIKIVVAFPPGGPVDLVARIGELHAALRTLLASGPYRKRIVDFAVEPVPGTRDQLAALVGSDGIKWGRIVRQKKILGE
jgi:tripartite-type tricarboxylate transporter receptor subunit TctC